LVSGAPPGTRSVSTSVSGDVNMHLADKLYDTATNDSMPSNSNGVKIVNVAKAIIIK
jgi:hypothetical protein